MRKNVASILCATFMILTATPVHAADGAASEAELVRLYQRYFQQKDEQKLATLVHWEGVEQRDRDAFLRSLQSDLKHRLRKVELAPLDASMKLEYTINGVTYIPAVAPVERMIAAYEDEGNVTHLSTTYLVGRRNGRYYIDLAIPNRGNPRGSDLLPSGARTAAISTVLAQAWRPTSRSRRK